MTIRNAREFASLMDRLGKIHGADHPHVFEGPIDSLLRQCRESLLFDVYRIEVAVGETFEEMVQRLSGTD